MRSQASKTSPTKGAVNKTQSKTKKAKKKTVAKKIKKVIRKPLTKSNKKNGSKNENEAVAEDKNEPHLETRASTSKSSLLQCASSTKKARKDPKEKKDSIKTIPDNAVKKTNLKTPIKKKAIKKLEPSAKLTDKSDESKYKLNKDEPKKKTAKLFKANTIFKKGKTCANDKKESIGQSKEIKDSDAIPKESLDNKGFESKSSEKIEESNQQEDNKVIAEAVKKVETKETSLTLSLNSMLDKVSVKNPAEAPKPEVERPPKFFTSSRSPRMVDIDVKCCKNSKGNLSVSERFVSLKCEVKLSEDKNVPNTLVSQGPEIDVYTFTEKVDSPKSILSDIRNPINQNIGRVRPIARVKGTVMDKKTESERKKFSPHRPIEEVVKQLKAKKSEEVSSNQGKTSSSFDLNVNNDEAPKPIVSKSYKMVARKSSVTGIPFSPIKFLDQDIPLSSIEKSGTKSNSPTKKTQSKVKKKNKSSSSDDEFESSKFSLNTQSFQYSSSEEYDNNESNDDTKESSTSDTSIVKKPKNKRYKKITDSAKKTKSSELKELSKDSLVDLKDDLLGSKKKGKRPHHRPLHKYWKGPKKQRMALLNAKLVVQNLLANEFQTNMDLGLMKTVAMQPIPSTSKRPTPIKKKETKSKDSEKHETTSESEYENTMEKKEDSSESSDDSRPQRTLREVPGIRSAGKYWDPKSCSSSSEDSELETIKKVAPEKKKTLKSSAAKSDSDKLPAKVKKTTPVKKKRNRNEVNMDFKDMVVQKRMASLNASAMIELSYEKRSPKSNKEETTTDSGSDESFSQKPKNGVASGVKSESKNEEPKVEPESDDAIEADSKQKVEVIVNQDTDVTITGVYSTHHHHKEGGYCTVSGMQYRISSTSHTQTTATTNCEKDGCSRDDGARYTPLSALSSMQPPAEHVHTHPPHPVPEIGGLNRRAGCSSAFSAPSPSAHHDPGYYQPAGPLIKETNNEDRALARYHPPHYHTPHPQMLPQYGPPYYPDLCYGRYYRPPGPPYPMQPPHTQADAPMGGIGGEPYPPPQYYGGPPCYQHSPQRIPYVEYRGCPCPLNACPKNVLIGPATGKAPAGAGPDVPSALAPPGGAFRSKVRACALDAAADSHGSGKDPPMEPEPPAGADVPHPCPIPAIGGASPKRELFDVRDNIRIASEVHGPGEAIGPPSPARGSAGVCAPQPPPSAPRRARLGKAMARRSLAVDDTQGLLLSVQQPPQTHSDADDDIVEISSPPCAPIDLSSSDERTTPLVDIKKENEGPTFASARKPDALALREHNSTTADTMFVTDSPKAVKRRYSRPKLEIDMKDTQLEEGCKTNGIGEHVKLIKRRKVSGDPPEALRVEAVTKEPKKKPSQSKRAPKSPPAEKKNAKRKFDTSSSRSRAKKILLEPPTDENPKVNNNGVLVAKGVQLVKEKDDLSTQIPKTKSALLLDNLIRKNSIDRADSKGYASDKELNPAELFLPPIDNIAQNCAKKMLNINNNVVENANAGNGVRPNTIAAVTELIEKKLAYKNACKLEKVDSKVMHKSVLKPPTARPVLKEDTITLNKCDLTDVKKSNSTLEKDIHKPIVIDKEKEVAKDKVAELMVVDKITEDITKPMPKDDVPAVDKIESQKFVERMETVDVNKEETSLAEVAKVKRCKMTEMKAKNVEKVVKLLVSKRPAIKTDEATLVVEEACASPVPSGPRRARRRGGRRGRRLLAPAALPDLEPRAPPRWSNGWNWDGEHHLSKVYLNNDSRLDRMARCWSRMTHTSGDKVSRGDCVLLRASVARAQPFVARVASLWENPEDGEMMVSLVWYYRPEHTDRGRQPADAPDEVFASRHRDANSVACIEDKCYVLTFNEYCRYRKRLKAAEEGVTIKPTIVPPLPTSEMNPAFAPNDSKLPPSVSPELVLFCRKIYDFRSKKIHVPNK